MGVRRVLGPLWVRDLLPNLRSARTAPAPGPPRRGIAELARRARKSFALTVIATSLLTGIFFVGYFYVQRHPVYTPTVMPLTAFDLLIPFQPRALFAYVSLWVYIGAGPGLQRTYRDFAVYGLWICALCISGLVIFYFWPTQVPPMSTNGTTSAAFDWLHRVDQSSNACPSMHVAAAVFTLVRVDDILRSTRSPLQLRLFNVAWCCVIAYSTLAIRQHVSLDVAAGACLGLVFALASLRWRPGVLPEVGYANVALPP